MNSSNNIELDEEEFDEEELALLYVIDNKKPFIKRVWEVCIDCPQLDALNKNNYDYSQCGPDILNMSDAEHIEMTEVPPDCPFMMEHIVIGNQDISSGKL